MHGHDAVTAQRMDAGARGREGRECVEGEGERKERRKEEGTTGMEGSGNGTRRRENGGSFSWRCHVTRAGMQGSSMCEEGLYSNEPQHAARVRGHPQRNNNRHVQYLVSAGQGVHGRSIAFIDPPSYE